MSESPGPVAGPSNHAGVSRTDPNLLRQFVMEYLQLHGFDKALAMFQQGIASHGPGDAGDADGEVEMDVGGMDGRRSSGGPLGGREAIFRAPGPVPIESTLKRNIPQAQAVSASTMSDHITPEFEAQARYIIEQVQRKGDVHQGDGDVDIPVTKGGGDPLLDPSDRIRGYKRYRRWVDNGLDLWRPELDGLSFPLFAHTFLDLLHAGFSKTARDFFANNRTAHEEAHPQEVSTLSSITDRQHIVINPLCRRLLSERYSVPMSRNSHDLLLQWLSGAGLDDEWEAGLHNSPGRVKEAVKVIVVSRIKVTVHDTALPLDKMALASSTGLFSGMLPTGAPLEKFNNSIHLKLGRAPMTDRLREQVLRTIQDEGSRANGHTSPRTKGVPLSNGHANGHANGDIDMGDESSDKGRTERSLSVRDIKIEPDGDQESDLVSPNEIETHPPVPAVFRIADLKREVEAVRDLRKMIRLGPMEVDKPGDSGTAVLPSVVAFTILDGQEGSSSVQFSQDSSLMAVGSAESCIRLWSLKGEQLKGKALDDEGSVVVDEGLPVRKLIGHSGPVYSLSFDPLYGSASPPQALLSSSQDGTVRLWSLDTYSNLVVYGGHNRDAVWDVEWGPMGVYFATGSRDRTARLWSSDRITPLRMYTGHLSDVNCVRFHPNSLYLATGSSDNSCRLWDVQRGACIRLFLGHTDAVTTMAISPDGRTLASAGLDSSIWLWDLGSSRPIKKMTGHRAPIQSLSFSAESSVLVSGGLDCTVRCWDVKSAGGEHRSGGFEGIFRGGEGTRRASTNNPDPMGTERGPLPMGPGDHGWDSSDQTSDLLATFYTKRTPISKTYYTPRNLCMVAGTFVPPSNAQSQ